jgi:carbonic anhydrase/acetyltransferase-like protein (isoleucine patch superfamily)
MMAAAGCQWADRIWYHTSTGADHGTARKSSGSSIHHQKVMDFSTDNATMCFNPVCCIGQVAS